MISIVVGIVLLFVGLSLFRMWDGRVRHGPVSPDGYRVEAVASDTGIMWSADWYVDVKIFAKDGREIGKWVHPRSQYSGGGVEQLMRSMKWEDKDVLTFQTYGDSDPVRLKVKP